jgi:hypothetical protein
MAIPWLYLGIVPAVLIARLLYSVGALLMEVLMSSLYTIFISTLYEAFQDLYHVVFLEHTSSFK